MDDFLSDCQQNLLNIEKKKVLHLVVGNESCDLDSAISSLVYAYILFLNKYALNVDAIVIPLLNINRFDLRLKNEVLFWIKEVLNLDLTLLICKDDIDLNKILKKNQTNILITLVDHNENKEFESIGTLVEIIDHHKQISRKESNIQVEINDKVGSCCSLIAARYFNYCEESKSQFESEITILLYGAIILDTICFSESAKRFDKLDLQMVEKIEYFQNNSLNRNNIYKQLVDAKNQVSSFSFEDLLFKDVKFLQTAQQFKVLFSSFSSQLVAQLLLKNQNSHQYIQQLHSTCLKKNYSAIVLMGISNANFDRIERDIAIFSLNSNLKKKIVDTLLNYNLNAFGLKEIEESNDFAVYSQNNIQASRKAILPVIQNLFESKDFKSELNSGLFDVVYRTVLESDHSIVNQEHKDVIKKSDFFDVFKSQNPTSGSIVDKELKNGQEKGKLLNNQLNIQSSNQINGRINMNGKNSQLSSNNAPESINYYESYFEDSFVGEFSGEVTNEKLIGQNIDKINWHNDRNDQNYFESCFDSVFDSFGPESLIFQSIAGENNINENLKKVEKIQESNEKKTENNELVKESLTSDKKNSITSMLANKNSNSNEQIAKQSQLEDLDLVSLSISEPQLKEKLNSCFDGDKIKHGYEILVDKEAPQSIIIDKPELINQNEYLKNYEIKMITCEKSIEFNSKFDSLNNCNDLNQETKDLINENALIKQDVNLDDKSLSSNKQVINENKEQNSNLNTEIIKNQMQELNECSKLTDYLISHKKNLLEVDLENKDTVQQKPDNTVFDRRSTIGKSQRRKITPKFNFNEILNTLDDSNLDSDCKFEKPLNYSNFNEKPFTEQQLPKNEGYSRTGTLKKKIVADYKEAHEEHQVINDDLRHCNLENKQKEIGFCNEPEAGLAKQTLNYNEHATNGFSNEQQLEDTRRNWLESCPIGKEGEVKKIDMKVIEPYKKVLSHAGYFTYCKCSNVDKNLIAETRPAIIIFSACYLPDRSRRDYDYVMDNLFMYVLTTLHELVADDYMLIYFHNAGCGSTGGNNMPTFNWLKRCYYMIDRRLRKNLKALYLVHPTFWLKTLVIMTKPFINSKFSKKLKFVNSLSELKLLVPIDNFIIPDPVKQVELFIEKSKKRKKQISS